MVRTGEIYLLLDKLNKHNKKFRSIGVKVLQNDFSSRIFRSFVLNPMSLIIDFVRLLLFFVLGGYRIRVPIGSIFISNIYYVLCYNTIESTDEKGLHR